MIWSGDRTRLVLMAIPENEEIGGEVRDGHDQLLYFAAGQGRARIGDHEMDVAEGDISIVPSGRHHNFRSTGSGLLKLCTTDSPPEHEPGTEHADRGEAEH